MTDPERFYHLCRYFLDSYNPKPDKSIVILDCVLAVPNHIIPASPSLRHFAHDFCQAATAAIDNKQNPLDWMPKTSESQNAAQWIAEWVKEHG